MINNSPVIVTAFYISKTDARQAEIENCLKRNVVAGLKVHLFVDDLAAAERLRSIADTRFPAQVKIARIGGGAPSYAELLRYASGLSPGTICVVSNADIYIRSMGAPPKRQSVLCLCRHEADGSTPMCDGSVLSHDAFVFRAPLPIGFDYESLPRRQNLPGAENIVANAFFRAGYKLMNPWKSWIIVHEHASEERGYDTDIREHLLYKEVQRQGQRLQRHEWGAISERGL